MSTTDAPFPKVKPAAAHPLKSEVLSSTSIPSALPKAIEATKTPQSPLNASLSLANPKPAVTQSKSSGPVNAQQPVAKATKPAIKQPVKKAPEQKTVNDPALGNVVSISNTAVKELFSSPDKINEAAKITATAVEAGRNVAAKSALPVFAGLESARQIAAKGADTLSRVWGESVAIRQNHREACTEAGALAAEVANQLAENALHFVHETVAENVDISKSVFACRTASDMIALQNRLAQSNIQRFINESARSSNLLFNFFSKVSEPFSETIASAEKRVKKALNS